MQIHTIDHVLEGVPNTIASFVVETAQGPILIETGPYSTIDTVNAGIEALGYAASDFKHVFVTHIHLDHAGAAWWWAQQGATIYVHPRGERHLLDPSRLIAGARQVFGANESDRLWGDIQPISADKVIAVEHNKSIDINGLKVLALSTEGHARHHHCFIIDDVAFVGDALGSRLPNESFINVTGAPPQFDHDAYLESIEMLSSLNLSQLYLTHFGSVLDVASHLKRTSDAVSEAAEFIVGHRDSGVSEATAVAAYVDWCKQRAADEGVSAETLHQYDTANPFLLSGRGIWYSYNR